MSAIGRIKDTKWTRPIQTDPSQRNPNLMCNYHGTHGHRTEDCRERDARNNEPEEPQHVVHMINGRVDVPQRHVFKRIKVSITREKLTRSYVPEDILSFCDEEAEDISQPHNDALVISFPLNKIQVKRVLVDPGNSANIIRSRVVEQFSLQDQIVPASRVLNGFNMASETTKEQIILLVNVARTIQDTKFHVIEGDVRYNELLKKTVDTQHEGSAFNSSPDDEVPNRRRGENSLWRATCCKRDICNRGSGANSRAFDLGEIEHRR
ncbi:uncharacterized protein [Nicotiana sylvestris]|uniref:uncharacterized protein n=1 Tax=Nicotiana sylvestris TaxID=4096 RepID=UPI00388C5044